VQDLRISKTFLRSSWVNFRNCTIICHWSWQSWAFYCYW